MGVVHDTISWLASTNLGKTMSENTGYRFLAATNRGKVMDDAPLQQDLQQNEEDGRASESYKQIVASVIMICSGD